MVAGTREHAAALRAETAAILAPVGLRLSEAKTRVVHLDEGFVFLGWHIQRRRKRGTAKRYVYTYPSKKALTPSRPRCGRSPREQHTEPWPTCCTGSIRRCGDGRPTSGTECPRARSATPTSSPGDASWAGYVPDTPAPDGHA